MVAIRLEWILGYTVGEAKCFLKVSQTQQDMRARLIVSCRRNLAQHAATVCRNSLPILPCAALELTGELHTHTNTRACMQSTCWTLIDM